MSGSGTGRRASDPDERRNTIMALEMPAFDSISLQPPPLAVLMLHCIVSLSSSSLRVPLSGWLCAFSSCVHMCAGGFEIVYLPSRAEEKKEVGNTKTAMKSKRFSRLLVFVHIQSVFEKDRRLFKRLLKV